MEEEGRQAAAAADKLIVIVRAGGEEHQHRGDVDGGDIARGSCCCCNLCGDVGFREALLPCGARGCSRLQHTYCGSRYCPEMVHDVKRWRCEWCAQEDGNRRVKQHQEEEEEGGEEETEDLRRKRSRRVPPSSSLSPPEIRRALPSPERCSIDKERRTACHREERRESTLAAGARAHAPQATSPSVGTVVSEETDLVAHKDKHSINTRGGGSRALDRWKNLAKRTRLGGKKYKLLADVLC